MKHLVLTLYYVGYFLFNPLSLILYFFIISESADKMGVTTVLKMEGNMGRYLPIPLFLSVFFFSTFFFVFSYVFVSQIRSMSLMEFLQPYAPLWQSIGFIGTALVISSVASAKGVEGNIMGFIFFPLLIFSSVALVVPHIRWVWSFVIKGVS